MGYGFGSYRASLTGLGLVPLCEGWGIETECCASITFTDRASLTGLGLVVLQVLGSLQSVVLGSTVTDRVSLTGLGSIHWVGRHLFELPNNCEL